MQRDLMIYQAYGAYFILRREVSWRLGMFPGDPRVNLIPMYLADECGFGKSATLTEIILLSVYPIEAHQEVDRSRQVKDRKHLPKSSREWKQPSDAVCPSNEPFPICCPCVETNPAAVIRLAAGVTHL